MPVGMALQTTVFACHVGFNPLLWSAHDRMCVSLLLSPSVVIAAWTVIGGGGDYGDAAGTNLSVLSSVL